MVEVSKLMVKQSNIGTITCSSLLHPYTDSCWKAFYTMLKLCLKGSFMFWTPIHGLSTIQILMKGKKLGKQEMIEQFKLYLKSGIFGLTVGSSFVTLNCIFRALFFSQFSYYTTVLLPCTVSGLAVYFEPPYRRVLVVNLFVNLVFEYWIKTLEMKGWLRWSPSKGTLIFMFGSAVFFYLMRRDRDNSKRTPLFWRSLFRHLFTFPLFQAFFDVVFNRLARTLNMEEVRTFANEYQKPSGNIGTWLGLLIQFFTPPRVSKSVGEPVEGIHGRSEACPHKGNCLNYVLKGTAQLFGVGCAMSMLRTIIPRILTPVKAVRSLRLSHLKLGMFFGGYIGIYRLVICLLCRKYGKDSALYAMPAGFLAGAAFRASPSTTIALAPITSSLQILGSWGYQKGLIPEKWPLIEILYCLCQGLLFHARVMHEDVCPRYIINLMHTVTTSKADEIQAAFIQRMLKTL